MKRALWAATAVAAAVGGSPMGVTAQRAPVLAVRATTPEAVSTWSAYVQARERTGMFRLRAVEHDPAFPGRTIERLQQYHGDVPVWGAEVVRDVDRGIARAIFGEVSPDLSLATVPALDARAAFDRFTAAHGAGGALLGRIELVILPLDSGEHRLAYTGVIARDAAIERLFLDAGTGAELLRYSEIHPQAAVGTGYGLVGDRKKMSVVREAGTHYADDRLRPPMLRTFDMRANFERAMAVFEGAPLAAAERAEDADNEWTDVSAIDGHTHLGWTYDYFFKRHGRRGFDDRDRPITAMINVFTQQAALTAQPDILFTFIVNAFWCPPCGERGQGILYFGNGIPPGYFFTATGQHWAQLAGALDVVAHEYAHGVISSTSRLLPRGEPGALNEGFADIIGTAVEFFYHPPGQGRARAEYLIGEDAVRGVRPGARDGIRSMEDPSLFGDPDHYSIRFTGSADSGGVHINATIVSHAFYLAVEGGTNRTSGLPVQGVGPANREQIERAFYRAFVFLLPANATFATARAATIQAARDLYGAGSAAERAITQAWTAVGVF
ncbi:MAG TPA: M4 family metallopeptidase [Vicinamibacterales bacterium]|nr:M4 family metallopeptidase [Vicinamibacterales bacterium]